MKLSEGIPESMLYAFWDIDKSKLSFERDEDFIISRMFERGKLNDLLSIILFYGKKGSTRAVVENEQLSKSGLHLAHVLLGIPLTDFRSYASSRHD